MDFSCQRADIYLLYSLGDTCVFRTPEQTCKTTLPRSRQCRQDNPAAHVEGALRWTSLHKARRQHVVDAQLLCCEDNGHMLIFMIAQNDRVAILQPTLHPSKLSQKLRAEKH